MQESVSQIIEKFLNRWSIRDVKRMTLEDYIDFNILNKHSKNFSQLGSINTFCYWVDFSFWMAKIISSEARNRKDFRFNETSCNKYGIASSEKLLLATYFKEIIDTETESSQKKFDDKITKLENIPFSDSLDKEGIYYEEYSLEEEINKESFYLFDDYSWKEQVNQIPNYGYSTFTLGKNKFSEVNWSLEYDVLNGKLYKSSNKYRWISAFGESPKEAFQNIKSEILKIIDSSQNSDFNDIDESSLSKNFAWKIAYLYSEENLIPIFRKSSLVKCAENLGYPTETKTNLSKIQGFLLERKPSQFKNNFDYAHYLLWSISNENIASETNTKTKNIRKSVDAKNTERQTRRAVNSYIVEQRHNLLQNKFSKKLIAKFGKSVVKLEENYVDIKLYNPDVIVFYEVKSDLSASACIRNALGQILWYAFSDTDERKKKTVVVGQFPPTNQEILFIEFLKQSLQIEFDYEYIDISDETDLTSEY